MEPLRGEVWEAHLPRAGNHPVVVLAVNVLIPRLSAVTVAVITGTAGPLSTHVPIERDAGLTGHELSYINATDLHTVDKPRLHSRRGLLHPDEMDSLEDAIRLYWACDDIGGVAPDDSDQGRAALRPLRGVRAGG